MKGSLFVILGILGLSCFFGGCSSPILFGVPEKAYLAGSMKHYGVNADGLNRNIEGRMAIQKLRDQPVEISKEKGNQGYKITIKNLSQYQMFNVRLIGPEDRSFPMFPGKKTVAFLTPGSYLALKEHRGRVIEQKPLTVRVQVHEDLDGEKCHGYIILED